MRSSSTALFLVIGGLLAFSPASAQTVVAIGEECPTVGETKMPESGEDLLACLYEDSSHTTKKWKSMISHPQKREEFENIGYFYLTTNLNETKTQIYDLPANATHVRFYARCLTLGKNGATRTTAKFNGTGPLASDILTCWEAGVNDGESSGSSSDALWVIPTDATQMTLTVQGYGLVHAGTANSQAEIGATIMRAK